MAFFKSHESAPQGSSFSPSVWLGFSSCLHYVPGSSETIQGELEFYLEKKRTQQFCLEIITSSFTM